MELEELCCWRTETQAKIKVQSKLGGCSVFIVSTIKKIETFLVKLGSGSVLIAC